MSAIAFLRELLDAGLDLDAALIAAEKFERKGLEVAEARTADRREKDAARKRAERERHAESRGVTRTGVESRGPSPHVRERSAPVVVSSSSSLRSEEGKEPPPTPNGVGAPKGAETARGSRIPENWSPVPDYDPEAFGLNRDQHDAELTKFLDYWRSVPGAKGRKVDWPATWRNWMRRAAENSARRPAHERPHPDAKLAAREANHARAFAGADLAPRWEP